jgi:hypothetical protein
MSRFGPCTNGTGTNFIGIHCKLKINFEIFANNLINFLPCKERKHCELMAPPPALLSPLGTGQINGYSWFFNLYEIN